jgi:hypothetical protein
MNRRNFLRGLVSIATTLAAAPVLIDEFARVYSFPSNIVIAQPTIAGYYEYVNFSSAQLTLVRWYDKKFRANLEANTPLFEMCKMREIPPNDNELKMYVPLSTFA